MYTCACAREKDTGEVERRERERERERNYGELRGFPKVFRGLSPGNWLTTVCVQSETSRGCVESSFFK